MTSKKKDAAKTITLNEFCARAVESHAVGDADIMQSGESATFVYYTVRRINKTKTVFGKLRFGLAYEDDAIYLREVIADMQMSDMGSITYTPRRVFRCKDRITTPCMNGILGRIHLLTTAYCVVTWSDRSGHFVDITLRKPPCYTQPARYCSFDTIQTAEYEEALANKLEGCVEHAIELDSGLHHSVHMWEMTHTSTVSAEQYAIHMLTLNATLHAQAAMAAAERMAHAIMYAAEIRAAATVEAAEIRARGAVTAALVGARTLNDGAASRQHELMGGIYRA